MTSREGTQLRALPEQSVPYEPSWSDAAYRMVFGGIGWPWLLWSLWGGTKASKRRLLDRLSLRADALPNLGSWKADTGFLHRIVDAVEELRPSTVVELGAGASTLVCAEALKLNGGGRLVSYDQHAGFVDATRQWLIEEGLDADIRHAPLGKRDTGWPGIWYDLSDIPATIDLLIIDGPPWAVHPYVRGAAEVLFNRLSDGAIILLDDAARPGERIVAQRWRRCWPGIEFSRLGGSTKGTLIGRKRRDNVVPFPHRGQRAAFHHFRRAAAVAALLVTGWIANDLTGDVTEPAAAATFVDSAAASYRAGLTRQKMQSQPAVALPKQDDIERATGLALPKLPSTWKLQDVEVHPSQAGDAVALTFKTPEGEQISLYAQRTETPAEESPLLERRSGQAVAYWEEGPFAYAVTGEPDAQVLALARTLSEENS